MKLVIKIEKISREDIQRVIQDEKWQEVRLSMKGTSLKEKIVICNNWLEKKKFSKESKIQIINYVNALKRSLYSKDILKYLN